MAMTAKDPNRIDRAALLAMANLAAIITADRGPADRSGKWLCPFHDDHHPSLGITRDGRRFKCWSCGVSGTVLDWYMLQNRETFMDAARRIDPTISPPRRPAKPTTRSPAQSSTPDQTAAKPTATRTTKQAREAPSKGLRDEQAVTFVQQAEARLRMPEGADALAYLVARGLRHETIRAARLGVTGPVVELTGHPRGIDLPWFDGGRLALVKIRQPEGVPPKYREVYRDRNRPPTLYPGTETIQPGRPLVIVEGEFDCLLMAQQLADHAAVVTLGSASSAPSPGILVRLLSAPLWLVAHDGDPAGDKAAAHWSGFPRAKRLRPPGGVKDWTDLHATGFNRIRYHVLAAMGWLPPTWEELMSQRWGVGRVGVDELVDENYDLAEREAIQSET
jgi:DNA primase